MLIEGQTWKVKYSEACKFPKGGRDDVDVGNVVISGLIVVADSIGHPVKIEESNVS